MKVVASWNVSRLVAHETSEEKVMLYTQKNFQNFL